MNAQLKMWQISVGMFLFVLSSSSDAAKTGQELMDNLRNSSTPRAEIVIEKPLEEIARLLEIDGARCTKATNVSTLFPVAGAYMPTATTVHQSIESGVGADGARWFAMRFGTEVHSILGSTIEISREDSVHTSAVIYRAKQNESVAWARKVLDGGFFCKLR